jgi:hypothetical protein
VNSPLSIAIPVFWQTGRGDRRGIVGTLFIIDVDSRAAATAFTENEPFHKAEVFESVLVRRWRQMQPEVSPGANAASAAEAEMQLREEGQ